MNRNLESVDVMVGIGAVVTLGALLLFFVIPGNILVPTGGGEETGPTENASIQLAEGEAILDADLASHRAEHDVGIAVRHLMHAVASVQSLEVASRRAPAELRSEWLGIVRDHRARLQFSMGTDIVHATSRGVRAGLLNADRMNGDFNRRLVTTVQTRGMDADRVFTLGLQPAIGRAIVATTLAEVSGWDRDQERIGQALVQIIRAQNASEARLGKIQEQLATLVMASARTEPSPTVTGSVDASNRSSMMEAVMSWGYWGIVIGLAALCALFLITMSIVYGRSGAGPHGMAGGASGTRHAA
ncbi:MAG TPA: hypothetical protein VFA38_10495 [Nitrospirales bacterium]|nr:hypothetical protein [Nitrospirales bacterium]